MKDNEVLEDIESKKHNEDLRSVLNKKCFTDRELEQVMMGFET